MNYLYNDKELPALPEWNKTKRPYVLLVSHPGSSLGVTPYHRMYCSQSPFVWSGSYATSSPTTGYGYTTMSEGDTEWGSVYEDETATRADTGASEKPIWSNHDILNKDGSVYLAASYPVNAETGEEIKDYAPIPILAPTIDPLSLFLGWKAGNWVARQRGKRQEPQTPVPVAYLYNGVQLPDINAVWTDKEKYPYAIIAGYTTDASETDGAGEIVFASLLLYKNAAEQGSDTSEHLIVGQHAQYNATNDQEIADFYGISELNAWCLHGKDDSEDATMSADAATWTSHDILNADGSVYLAASDPIPVY